MDARRAPTYHEHRDKHGRPRRRRRNPAGDHGGAGDADSPHDRNRRTRFGYDHQFTKDRSRMSTATQPLAIPRVGLSSLLRDYSVLVKARVTTLIILTALCGADFAAGEAGFPPP